MSLLYQGFLVHDTVINFSSSKKNITAQLSIDDACCKNAKRGCHFLAARESPQLGDCRHHRRPKRPEAAQTNQRDQVGGSGTAVEMLSN